MEQIPQRARLLVYSDDSSVRGAVVSALGTRLRPGFPVNEIQEFATSDALHAYIDSRGGVKGSEKFADVIILDGEAVPEGGMGIARQLKDEVYDCPPILLITAREDDAWLAAWSRAEAVVMHPINPFTFGEAVSALLTRPTPVEGAKAPQSVEY